MYFTFTLKSQTNFHSNLSQIKKYNLYNEDAITFWRERRERPEYKNFVEGGTPSNSYNRPFKKDLSFTNPLDNLSSICSGSEAPFKEFRDLKMM